MSWSDTLHYVLIGNPLSKTVITAATDVAKTTAETTGNAVSAADPYVRSAASSVKDSVKAIPGATAGAVAAADPYVRSAATTINNSVKDAVVAADPYVRSAASTVKETVKAIPGATACAVAAVDPYVRSAIPVVASVASTINESVKSAAYGLARGTAGLMSSTKSGPTNSAKSAATQMVSKALPLWRLAGPGHYFVRFAGLSGASAVILAAYGAHREYDEKRPESRRVFETANRFHFFHTIALATMPLVRYPIFTGLLMIAGTTLFVGPCYYRALTGKQTYSRFAPMGGGCLILAWLSMML